MYNYRYITIHSNTNHDKYIEFFFLDKDGNKALAMDFNLDKNKQPIIKEVNRLYEYKSNHRYEIPADEAIKLLEY
jgi:hypothetical protein